MKYIYLLLVSILATTKMYNQENTIKFANAGAPSFNIGKDILYIITNSEK